MAVILKKLKGKTVHKANPEPEWEQLLLLLKLLIILFVIFSCFHWIVKKKVQHLPAQTQITALPDTQGSNAPFMRAYTVKEGDTLWKIVLTYYPNENPVNKIKEIQKINQMSNDSIQPGQPLKLP
ncbi:LysM peptidoglycan-binding domain-containing protein [Ammoniphilus sp. 3BR4]|uniref:LysM peptidoglycan-binding domain-containing protein n=1 Tax=Ammoniphilus sp. 3BR4 TaxID=3158265 RepID=UPI003465FFEC